MKTILQVSLFMLALGLTELREGYAQKPLIENPVFTWRGENPRDSLLVDFMRVYFATHFRNLDTLQVRGSAFVKFRLDQKGRVSKVQCTVNTPAPLAAALEEAIWETSGYWTPRKVKGEPVASQDLLLPVDYWLAAGNGPEKDIANIIFMLRFEGAATATSQSIIEHMKDRFEGIVFSPFIWRNSIYCEAPAELIQKFAEEGRIDEKWKKENKQERKEP